MKLAACAALPTYALTGTWFRAVKLKFWKTLLATAHTTTIPGRFNRGSVAHPGFEILYFTEDHLVALFEVQALLGSSYPGATYVPNPKSAWTVINVDVQLQKVADLTIVADRKVVQTTVQELTGDWRGYQLRKPHAVSKPPYWSDVPTQRLGQALHGVPDLEGFLTYSAKVATKKNLIVFPKKLLPGSSLKFHDPTSKATVSIP
jgi:RES domain-containing protein